MTDVLLYTILTLCALGVLAAVILYFVAQKFKVYEDPRIDVTETMLPGANCGGCGYPGCRGFAEALVKNDDISMLYCPVGGTATMSAVAEYLGKAAPEKEPMVAVVRCAGSCEKRPRTNTYDGAASCAVSTALYGGDTGCTYGCLGKGDCVAVCNFDAIHINPETLLPEVDEEKCTACGACVTACPKVIIELRRKGPKSRRVFVSCINEDKGGIARKACAVACIGCGKCVKVCPFEAITLENNLAYIDYNKCKICRKCVPECPTGAIWEVNFPPRPAKEETPAAKATPKASSDKTAPTVGKPTTATEKAAAPKTAPVAAKIAAAKAATVTEAQPAKSSSKKEVDEIPAEDSAATLLNAKMEDVSCGDGTSGAVSQPVAEEDSALSLLAGKLDAIPCPAAEQTTAQQADISEEDSAATLLTAKLDAVDCPEPENKKN